MSFPALSPPAALGGEALSLLERAESLQLSFLVPRRPSVSSSLGLVAFSFLALSIYLVVLHTYW